MDSLVGYGSEDENEIERNEGQYSSVGHSSSGSKRAEDGTNYDAVNMDMSEESESEPELPPAEPAPAKRESRDAPRSNNESRERERDREKERDSERDRERERDSERRRTDRDRRRDDKHSSRSDRERDSGSSRRGLLGDRPRDRNDERSDAKVPSLMDVKPFGGDPPPPSSSSGRSHDARDAVSPRFADRDRRVRDRERDRDRHSRRSEEKSGRSGRERHDSRSSSSRSRDRDSRDHKSRTITHGHGHTHGHVTTVHEPHASSSERRVSPTPTSSDYRSTSYKVNKKLEVMEKMGLQIKTPDGSMATAQQLRQAASEAPLPTTGGALPSYYNPTAVNTNKILDQVQKRKLLWSNKNKSEAEEAAKWSGTRFAQDNDGRQATKFMRLMGIKDQAALKPEAPDKTVDPIKKQEELFHAMQQQYEVARATTHTMRGVGLGFQRGQFQ